MKEKYEWVQIWKENANDENLPRILLIGDSITNGYYEFVKNHFKGVYNVDKLVMSYSLESKSFISQVKSALYDYRYDIVHFNNGLHGKHLSVNRYKKYLIKILKFLKRRSAKIIVADITEVLNGEHTRPCGEWSPIVEQRNNAIYDICRRFNLPLSRLFEVSLRLKDNRSANDGFHFTPEGYEKLAEAVISNLEKIIVSSARG